MNLPLLTEANLSLTGICVEEAVGAGVGLGEPQPETSKMIVRTRNAIFRHFEAMFLQRYGGFPDGSRGSYAITKIL